MKSKIALLFSFTVFMLLSCKEKDNQSFQMLDMTSFEEKLNSSPDKILLDVRTPSEYQQGHLENSILIDIHGSDFKGQISKLNKSKPVFVYCLSGKRSEKAAAILIGEGFKEVYQMDGGMKEWADANKPIVKD